MAEDVLVKVDHVSKKFCRNYKHSMLYGFEDIIRELTFTEPKQIKLRKDEFLAVDDVSFELRRGECIGLIGPNGSGKSTLLKLLNGLIMPDAGTIMTRGKIGALIELTAGFNQTLTGKENIYNSGAVLGMDKSVIDAKYDSIVEFSELREYINMPVQNYSSGMKVRLGFSVAAHMDPDILFIDEVLAVGDVGFRTKCLNAISEICKKAAVIFVSHSMPQVTRLCNQIMVLNHGKELYCGSDIPFAVEKYHALFKRSDKKVRDASGCKITKLLFNGSEDKDLNIIPGDSLEVEIEAEISSEHDDLEISIDFLNQGMDMIATCNSRFSYNPVKVENKDGRVLARVKIDHISFSPGFYYISTIIRRRTTYHVLCWHYCSHHIILKGDFQAPINNIIEGHWRVNE